MFGRFTYAILGSFIGGRFGYLHSDFFNNKFDNYKHILNDKIDSVQENNLVSNREKNNKNKINKKSIMDNVIETEDEYLRTGFMMNNWKEERASIIGAVAGSTLCAIFPVATYISGIALIGSELENKVRPKHIRKITITDYMNYHYDKWENTLKQWIDKI